MFVGAAGAHHWERELAHTLLLLLCCCRCCVDVVVLMLARTSRVVLLDLQMLNLHLRHRDRYGIVEAHLNVFADFCNIGTYFTTKVIFGSALMVKSENERLAEAEPNPI